MNQAQYQVWLSALNAGIKSGLSMAEALAQADKLAQTVKG